MTTGNEFSRTYQLVFGALIPTLASVGPFVVILLNPVYILFAALVIPGVLLYQAAFRRREARVIRERWAETTPLLGMRLREKTPRHLVVSAYTTHEEFPAVSEVEGYKQFAWLTNPSGRSYRTRTKVILPRPVADFTLHMASIRKGQSARISASTPSYAPSDPLGLDGHYFVNDAERVGGLFDEALHARLVAGGRYESLRMDGTELQLMRRGGMPSAKVIQDDIKVLRELASRLQGSPTPGLMTSAYHAR